MGIIRITGAIILILALVTGVVLLLFSAVGIESSVAIYRDNPLTGTLTADDGYIRLMQVYSDPRLTPTQPLGSDVYTYIVTYEFPSDDVDLQIHGGPGGLVRIVNPRTIVEAGLEKCTIYIITSGDWASTVARNPILLGRLQNYPMGVVDSLEYNTYVKVFQSVSSQVIEASATQGRCTIEHEIAGKPTMILVDVQLDADRVAAQFGNITVEELTGFITSIAQGGQPIFIQSKQVMTTGGSKKVIVELGDEITGTTPEVEILVAMLMEASSMDKLEAVATLKASSDTALRALSLASLAILLIWIDRGGAGLAPRRAAPRRGSGEETIEGRGG